MRKPFQGVWNIVRFNWHFFLLSASFILLIYLLNQFLFNNGWLDIICILIITIMMLSLFISWYIYDLSGFYTLRWLDELEGQNEVIVNIHAGFDEISSLLQKKYTPARMKVLDFYDPSMHTEVSIKRARRAYPCFPGTLPVSTGHIPLPDNYTDSIFVIFSAHEIRQEQERALFFNELKRVVKPEGKIVITEHLRDLPNFIAYTIGFFHFFPKSSWLKVFRLAELNIFKEIKTTPFVTTFILRKNGTAS